MKHFAKKANAGQSLTEYVLLLMVIAGMGKLLWAIVPKILNTVSGPFMTTYAQTYKYGRPEACGQTSDDDPPGWKCAGVQFHPRYTLGQGGTSYMFARGP